MSDSPTVAREFLRALEDFSNVEGIVSFFADDAVYVDPMRGENRGVDAIRTELKAQAAMGFDDVTIDVKSLVTDGGTVMMERRDAWKVRGKPFSLEVMAIFELDPDGRIKRWRDSYDSKSATDQLAAAGYSVPE